MQKKYIQHIHAAHASAPVQATPQTLIPLVLEVYGAAVAEQPERQVQVYAGVDDKVHGPVELVFGVECSVELHCRQWLAPHVAHGVVGYGTHDTVARILRVVTYMYTHLLSHLHTHLL